MIFTEKSSLTQISHYCTKMSEKPTKIVSCYGHTVHLHAEGFLPKCFKVRCFAIKAPGLVIWLAP